MPVGRGRFGIDEHLATVDGAAVTYYVADYLGSIAQTTDSTGAVTLTRKYDPWGNPLAAGGTGGYAFTGREWDSETGLGYYRARYYGAALGRFISEDPIPTAARFVWELNAYAYARSSPVILTDPHGLEALFCVQRVSQEVSARHCANNGHAADDPSCREAHCIANCRTTRECAGGSATAAGASYAKKLWDEFKRRTYDTTSEGYSRGDQAANKKGRICGTSPYGKAWTCEELCRGSR